MKNDINPVFQTPAYALLPEQQLLQTGLDAAACQVQKTLQLSGAWDARRLQAALQSSLARHDALTLQIGNVAGYSLPRQHFSAAPASAVEVLQLAREQFVETLEGIAAAQRRQIGNSLRATIWQQDGQAWLLVLTASRLLLDEASLDIIWQQTLQAYQQAEGNNLGTDDADEDAFQYQQYLEWRQELLADADAAEGRQYWRQVQQARQDIADAGLPCRTERAGQAGCSATVAIAPGLAQQLSALAAQRQVELEVLLQAAWWLLLARVGGVEAVRGDWRQDCRADYEVMAATVGVFEKLLPVQLACPAEAGLWIVVGALQEQLQSHRLRQEYWGYETDVTQSSRAAFSCVRAQVEASTAAPAFASLPTPPAIAGMYELLLQIAVDAQDGASQATEATLYAAAVYDAASVDCLLDQYLGLLAEIAGQGDNQALRVQDLNMYGQLDRRYADGWHGAAITPAQESFNACISSWAAHTPQALALTAQDLSLTYAQLESQVARGALALRRQGVAHGDVVALMAPRSGALVVALLAIMRAGAAYLPLDPDWPAARTQAILADARPSLLVLDAPAAAAQLKAIDALPPQLAIDALLTPSAQDDDAAPALTASGDDTAYVIYTSGSTGNPKGVPITHRQLINYVSGVTQALGLDQSRRFALTSTVAADLGNTSLFGALANGAGLIVADSADMADVAHFADFMRRHQVEVLKIVPSHFSALIAAGQPYFPNKLILGGEAAAPELLQQLREQAPDCRVFNHYGPTETTVGVLVHAYDADPADQTGTATGVGAAILSAPLANCSIYLLDAHGKAAPVGAIGELYVGGAQVSRGYIGARSGATEFVAHPTRAGERVYRTGDLARRRPDGAIVLAGRSDDQVKIRGFRIEPAEVEHACKRLDGVADAAVRIWQDDGQPRIAAYLVLAADGDGAAADTAALRQQLAALLPAAFMPAYLEQLPAIPRLGNGKVDRQRLTDPRQRQIDDAEAAASVPASALESLLLRVAADLLKKDDLRVTQNFFDVGGDSLLAIRFVAKARELLKIALVPGDIFASSSMRVLAARLLHNAADPQALEKLAGLRWKLMNMSKEELAALERQALARPQSQAASGAQQ